MGGKKGQTESSRKGKERKRTVAGSQYRVEEDLFCFNMKNLAYVWNTQNRERY